MSVAREDVLLAARALKRGWTDARGIRKALDLRSRRDVAFAGALHLDAARAADLAREGWTPDPAADRALLEDLRALLLESGDETARDWDKFLASLGRPAGRQGFPGLQVPQEFDGLALKWELARRERGVVYRAVDASGAEQAVKVFRPDAGADASLPRVGGLAYSVAPFEEGESLESRKPSPRRSAEALLKAADQLRSRPHGALHPARILLRKDDSVAVTGFEHAKALPPSARARACAGGSDAAALASMLRDLLDGTDARLAAVAAASYDGVGDFADDLGRALRGEPVTGRAAATSAAPRKSRTWIPAAAAVLALAAGAGAWVLSRSRPLPVPPASARAPEVHRSADPPRAAVAAPGPVPTSAPPAPPLRAEEEDALYRSCLSAIERGDRDRVILVAGEAAARGSVKEWPYYHLAAAYLGKGDLDAALARVTRALELAPESRDALELRAQTHAMRGEVARTLDDLGRLHGGKAAEVNRQILQLGRQSQSDPAVRLLRGAYFQLKRNHESAAMDFTAAIDGGLRRALLWRAHALRGAEDRERAAADARAFLEEFSAGPSADDARRLLAALGG